MLLQRQTNDLVVLCGYSANFGTDAFDAVTLDLADLEYIVLDGRASCKTRSGFSAL